MTGNVKSNRSETNVSHRDRRFKEELGCQVLQKYYRVSKKPTLLTLYEVAEEQFKMDEGGQKQVGAKGGGWVLSKMELSNEELSEINEKQLIPSWSAFNSLVTDENVPLKIVGFLPVSPFPVTEYATVYTSLNNF